MLAVPVDVTGTADDVAGASPAPVAGAWVVRSVRVAVALLIEEDGHSETAIQMSSAYTTAVTNHAPLVSG